MLTLEFPPDGPLLTHSGTSYGSLHVEPSFRPRQLGGSKVGGSKVGGCKVGGCKVGGCKVGGCKVGGCKVVGCKDGGSLKVSFLAKNQHATKEKSLENSYE